MFYRPENSVAADVIPFYRDHQFQLFYLRDFRDVEKCGEGTPWYLLSTKDFVHYEERGEVIKRGKKEEQDLYVFTGSVFEEDGINYIFYTGHNPHFIQEGKYQEGVMLAVSTDFKTWKKVPEFILYPPDHFEPHDFRDPFVFYNEETKEYQMLLAARLKEGPDRRRGCTAVAVSKDLKEWIVKEEPFYAPTLYYAHECPDLFQMGDWWYLIFSEFADKCETHYCMSKSLSGPWITPDIDTFDNRNFYAAKTTSDGKDRYIFGWNPTNQGDKDFHDTMWGGNIVVHKIIQDADGHLFVECPQTVLDQYKEPLTYKPGRTIGTVQERDKGWLIGQVGEYSSIDLGTLSPESKISFDVTFEDTLGKFYVFLNSDEENEKSYYIGIEPGMSRMTFDRWPRKRADYPFMVELERKIVIEKGKKYHFDILINHTVLEVYAGGTTAMSARMYDLKNGTFGFATTHGKALIENMKYTGLSSEG